MGPLQPQRSLARRIALAKQRRDDAAGRFADRVFLLNFETVHPTQTTVVKQPVTSLGGPFVRMIAMRGSSTTRPFTVDPFLIARLRVRIRLNGQEDLITGNAPDNSASFSMLFMTEPEPWYWFWGPPRLRTGDILSVSITNPFPDEEGAPSFVPEFAVRFIDDDLWTLLYGEDVEAAELEGVL